MVEVEVPLPFSSDSDPVLNITNIRLFLIEDPNEYNNIFIVLLDVTITLEKNEMNTAVMLVLLVPGMDVSRLPVGKASRNLVNTSFSLAPKLTAIYDKLHVESQENRYV